MKEQRMPIWLVVAVLIAFLAAIYYVYSFPLPSTQPILWESGCVDVDADGVCDDGDGNIESRSECATGEVMLKGICCYDNDNDFQCDKEASATTVAKCVDADDSGTCD